MNLFSPLLIAIKLVNLNIVPNDGNNNKIVYYIDSIVPVDAVFANEVRN